MRLLGRLIPRSSSEKVIIVEYSIYLIDEAKDAFNERLSHSMSSFGALKPHTTLSRLCACWDGKFQDVGKGNSSRV